MALDSKTTGGGLEKTESMNVGTPLSEADRLSLGKFSQDVSTTRTGPNTAVDMYNMEKWKKGETEPIGTQAKSIPAFKRYRRDMDNAPKESEYDKNAVYIDTLKPVGPQLDRIKRMKR